ncbi:MAG: ribose ABC transporter permease [Actinomycetales bacterium]|nr:MAG: ribose ABC transporter permease [Actinomycetales bacterium]
MFTADNFASLDVLGNVLMAASAIGTMALGATFVIATSGIDLSVGTGMTLCAVMAGMYLSADKWGLPVGVGLVLILLTGALLGLVNGLNISVLGIPPFIATLAMMMVANGLALVISEKSSIKIGSEFYYNIANGKLFSIGKFELSNSALLFLAMTLLAAFLLGKTLLGRYALAMGSNEEATRLSGVNVRFWKTMVYVVAGVFTAVGAIIYSARFGFAQPAEGLGLELQAIAAVVIGGTSLAGGRATIVGTFIGALLMNTLTTGLQMMGVAKEWQLVVIGIVILMAVFADNVRRKRAAAV